MPTLSLFYGIIISMNYRDHNPPHIHAEYQGKKALIGLDGEVMEGALPKTKLRMVQVWVDIHREDLEANWELAQKKAQLFKIDPLR